MQTTTISSIRVKPGPARRRSRGPKPGLRTLTVAACKSSLPQIPHGEEYPERKYQHQHAEQHDQDGLDLRGQGLQLVFDLPLVHFGHFAQKIVELARFRSEEHTSELQSPYDLVCRLLL